MGKKTPKTPDPVATAAAQAGQNTMAANANTVANSGSVTNPYGTRTSQIEYMPVLNPLTGKMENVARNNVTETLSQGQQNIFNENQSSETNLAKYGNQQTAELLKRGGTPFQYDTGQHEQWAGNLYDKLNSEDIAANDEALRTRLSNQGIKMGSGAYDREVANFAKGRDKARNDFLLNSQQQGFQQALAQRNQQTNEPLAIASGTQIQMPNFNGGNVGNVATTDYAGIQNAATQNDWARYNAKQSQIGGVLSGIGGLFALSEPKMKKNKEKLPAKTKDGIQMWSYNYKGEKPGTPKHVGVMASEAEKKRPDMVVRGRDGMRRVNSGIMMGA